MSNLKNNQKIGNSALSKPLADKAEIMRHSLAHIMAVAVMEIMPEAKFGIGPAIENGFYYDFDLPQSLIPEDLPKIEAVMKRLIKENLKFEKIIMPIDKAMEKFKVLGQDYKVELLEDLKKQGQKEVSLYQTGKFIDLCRGPHIEATAKVGVFKLTRLAGAYWRGDEKNKMLTRIYGVAFASQKELDEYLKMLAEAEKRDHRKIGKELDLFMFSEEVGQGLVMYLPKGAFVWRQLENYMYEKEFKHGYSFVITPILAKEEMYKKSGHLSHYSEDMYNPLDIEGKNYYLKPMNCPHHHIMYKNSKKSYRDLPIRFSDSSIIHRYERSGVLTGLIRARNFYQNDAHIYCTKEQVKDEFINVLKLFSEVYKDFSIKNYWFRLSLPDYNNKEKYGDIENKEMWQYSTEIARKAMKEYKVKYEEVEGEAAFYGPKIDVQIKNVFGKEDTIATIQVDFYMPERFDLKFVNSSGKEERPIIIHRAIMGSFDRFFAFLIEQTAGAFPVWLSPVQIKIIPVGKDHFEYSNKLARQFREFDLRVEVDDLNETVGYKIRKAEKQKVPYMLVIGDKEMKSKSLNIRHRDQKEVVKIGLKKFIEQIKKEIESKK